MLALLLTLATGIAAYAIGYRVGHVAGLRVPYAMLAVKMEDLILANQKKHGAE
jgi:hypothetical protein